MITGCDGSGGALPGRTPLRFAWPVVIGLRTTCATWLLNGGGRAIHSCRIGAICGSTRTGYRALAGHSTPSGNNSSPTLCATSGRSGSLRSRRALLLASSRRCAGCTGSSPRRGGSGGVALNVDDLLEEEVIRLCGKGGKERIVPLGSYARRALEAYLVRARAVFIARGTERARRTPGDTAALFLG